MAYKSEIGTEKYEGPGKLTAAVGDAKIYGFVGSLGGAVAGAVVGATVKPDGKMATRLADVFLGSRHSSGQLSNVRDRKSMMVWGAAIAGSAVAGVASAILGILVGWKNGNRGEQQFNAIKSQRDEANIRNEGLQNQVNGLNEEVGAYRKRFSENTTSRSAHGSHASAAEADKSAADLAAAR